MGERSVNIYIRLVFSILAAILLMIIGCFAHSDKDFAIYLTKDDIPPDKMEALSHVRMAEKPIIELGDIVTYNATTHAITLTAEAFASVTSLEVPMSGRSFMVCVDRQPIYWGAFWTPISSMSFEGVTIWKPLGSWDVTTIKLELGYPSASFFTGTDPRNNTEVMQSLEKAGKLIRETTGKKLPRSMKGYELYSWLQQGQWHFKLITGANRNKTLEEIIQNTDAVSEDGWVNIHVTGVEAIKSALSRLPQNEHVFWYSTLHVAGIPDNIKFAFPDAASVDKIQEYACLRGLVLMLEPH